MSPDRLPPIPQALVDAAQHGRLVVLVGAGASCGSGLPGWEDLLDAIQEEAKAVSTTEVDNRLLDAATRAGADHRRRASYLERILGRTEMRALVVQRLTGDTIKPTGVHTALAQLTGALFVTTNYDDLLERALRMVGRDPRIVIDKAQDIHASREGDVFKLHGDIHRPSSIVLTTADYDRMLAARSAAWRERFKTFLQAGHQLLLVGYGYGDEDIRRVVEELRDAYSADLVRPYWLDEEDPIKRVDADQAGLELIALSSYADMPRWLEELASAARLANPALHLALYRDTAWEGLEADAREAAAAYEAGEWAQAAERYRALRDRAGKLDQADPKDRARHKWRTATFNLASALLELEDTDEAEQLLHELTNDLLGAPVPGPRELRLKLASLWAQLREPTRAEALLSGIKPEEQGEEGALVRICAGELPDPLPTSDLLLSQLALTHARARRFAEVGEVVRHIATTAHLAPVANAFVAGATALLSSALGSTDALTTVAAPERAALLTWVEDALGVIRTRDRLPAHARTTIERIAKDLYGVTGDTPRWEQSLDRLRHASAGTASEPAALAGQEGPQTTSRPDPSLPWQGPLRAVGRDWAEGRREDALRRVTDLLRDWPEVSPVLLQAAMCFRESGRHDEALRWAGASERALPGRGAMLLQAQCLAQLGRTDEAFNKLGPLLEAPPVDPEALRIAAWSRLDVAPADAADLYERYLQTPRGQHDGVAWVEACKALADSGRHADALATANRALQVLGDRLDAKLLYALSEIPRLAPPSLAVSGQDLLRQVYERLGPMSSADPTASEARLKIYLALGEPADLERPDLSAVLAAGRVVHIPSEQVIQLFREGVSQAQNAWEMWRSGLLPYEAFTQGIGRDTATVLTQVLAADDPDNEDALLRPPHPSLDFSVDSLHGARLLMGDLELYLLVELDLLDHLRRRLGPGGRIVVFKDVWTDRLREVSTRLRLEVQPGAVARNEALDRWLTSNRRVELITAPDKDDLALAVEHHATVVTADDAGLSTDRWVRLLVDQGVLPYTTAARFLSEGTSSPPTTPPKRAVLSYPALQQLWAHDLLDTIVSSLPPRAVIVGPHAWRRHQTDLIEARNLEAAARRAEAVRDAVIAGHKAGWLILRPRPVEALDRLLPPPRTPAHEGYRAVLVRLMSWHYALHEDPTLRLVTADEAVANNNALLGLRDTLAWTSDEQPHEVMAPFLGKGQRVIALSDLASSVTPEALRQETIERLAEFGFPGVFEPHDILVLARNYNGYRGRALRLLRRSEWHARAGRDIANATTFRLGLQYSRAIWMAWCGDEDQRRGLDPRHVAAHLLDRLLQLSPHAAASPLEQGLMWLLLRAATDVMQSYRRTGEGLGKNSRMTPDETTPAGLLWTWLTTWVNQEGARRRAWDRALHEAIVSALKPPQLDMVGAGALVNALQSSEQLDAFDLTTPGTRELTILQAADTREPRLFAQFDFAIETDDGTPFTGAVDAAVVAAAREVEAGFTSLAAAGIAWEVALPLDEAHVVRCAVPPEAAILYADPSSQRVHDVAHGWAHEVVLDDARLAAAWSAFAQAPGAPQARWHLATTAARAAPAELAEDPLSPMTWGTVGPTVRLHTLGDLRELLGEPEGEPEDLPSEIKARMEPGGAWHEGPNRLLWRQATELPGIVSIMRVRDRMQEEHYAAEVSQALQRLRASEQHTCGTLAADLAFLRCAAALRPEVQLEEGLVDLVQILPGVVATVLDAMLSMAPVTREPAPSDAPRPTSGPPPHTLASLEAGWLRACAIVVDRVAANGEGRSLGARSGTPTTRLWTTWRLYQWWTAQVAKLSLEGRQLALQRLSTFHRVPDWPRASTDHLLDPLRFDPTAWDHRLASLLFAIHASGSVAREFLDTEGRDADSVPGVISEGVQDRLTDLALRPCTEAERAIRHLGEPQTPLGWHGPAAVPDLALLVLLQADASLVRKLTPSQRGALLAEAALANAPADRRPERCVRHLLRAFAGSAHALDPEEVGAWLSRTNERLAEGDDDGMLTTSFVGAARLLGAGRLTEPDLTWSALEAQLAAHPSAPSWSDWLGEYLVALSHARPDAFQTTWERWHEVARDHEPAAALLALGRVLVLGSPAGVEAASTLLRSYVRQAPFSDDRRVRALAAILG